MKKANLAMMMGGLMMIASQVTPGWGLDVNEKITFEGTFTGVYQKDTFKNL